MPGEYKCSTCGLTFETAEELEEHVKNMHMKYEEEREEEA